MVLTLTKTNAQCTGPVAGNFTINSALPTAGTNFQTMTEAVWSLACGVTGPVVFSVTPGSGPYTEQIVINAIPGTSATNTVTFKGNGETLNFSSNNTALRACVELDGAKHVIIDSFRIIPILVGTLDFEYAYGVQLIRNADSNIVRNCSITIFNNNLNVQNNEGIVINGSDETSNLVAPSYCDDNLIINNKINGGYNGVVLNSFTGYGAPIVLMNNNKVIGNTIWNYLHSGINMIYTNNTLIQGNDIDVPIETNGGNVINLDELNQKAYIDGNKIHKFASNTAISTGTVTGITMVYGKPSVANGNTIVNNLFYDIPNNGELRLVSLETTANVKVYHNTFVLDNTANTGAGQLTGIYMDGVSSGIKINNNLFSISQGGTGSKYGIYSESSSVVFSSDNNNFHITSTGGSNNAVGRYNGTKYTSLAAWKTGSGKDANSISVDPLYTNAAAKNYKPTAIPLDDLGLYLNVEKDITGLTRSNVSPDAGAYEYGAILMACTTPPTAGTTQILPSPFICGGSTATLKLLDNSVGIGQTYQWQYATTATGTYTNIGGLLTSAGLIITPATTLFYRAEVTCSGLVSYSTPVKITVTNIMSGAYTINKNEAASDRNFQSFAQAIAAMGCGVNGPVTITVAPGSGPYTEQVVLGPVSGMSSNNTVTFKGSNETLNYLSTNTNQRAVIKFDDADFFIIDSLNVTALATAASGQYGFGIQIMNNSDSNIIRNCNVTVNATNTVTAYAGISITGSATSAQGEGDTFCDGNLITGNTVIGGYFGITVVANVAPANTIYDNKITNNIVKEFYSYGILVTGTMGTLIEGNDISRPTRTTTNSTFYPIGLVSLSSGVKVSKNRIHNLMGGMLTNTATMYAISASGADATTANPNVFVNNLVYDMNGAGPQYGIYSSNSDTCLYYHNTISLDDLTNTSTAVTRGIYQTTAATGIEFKNNIVTIRRTGTAAKHAIYMNTTGTTYASDYNDFLVASTSTTNYIGYANGTNYSSMANWRTGSSKDANSLNLNPTYSNIATGNFMPALNTLDNKGTALGITTDIVNVTRDVNKPDMGAYEFGIPLPVKLIDISAIKTGNDGLVTWITASEINTKEFAIEWSVDGIAFKTAGTTPALGNGDYHTYSFVHKNIVVSVSSKIIYYRLKMIDKDGSYEYSKIVTIQLDKKGTDIVSVFPNPFMSSLYAKITTANPAKATIEVRDAAGRLVTVRTQQVAQGSSLVEINNMSNLAKGMYLVSVEINGTKHIYKVTK